MRKKRFQDFVKTHDHVWDVVRTQGCWVDIGSWRQTDALLLVHRTRRCSNQQRQRVAAQSSQTSSPTPTQLASA